MKLSVLGATGSIGDSLFEVVAQQPEAFSFEVLAGGANVSKMARLIAQHRPKLAVMATQSAADELRAWVGSACDVAGGEAALLEAAARPVDLLVSAITGIAGLRPTWAAIEAGNDIALANKESLVCAGALLTDLVTHRGVKLWPIDSEHNAILQCLEGSKPSEIDSVTLTASGGPFAGWDRQQLRGITKAQALAHPNWSMGAKITIDSSTLVNKGLELIEAGYLFDLPEERIHTVVHRQSIIHSFVHYRDGSSLAQMSYPSMVVPIGHVLAKADGGERLDLAVPRLDAATLGALTFEPVDNAAFPALKLARQAFSAGGSHCLLFNSINEQLVAAFLADRGGYADIVEGIDRALQAHQSVRLSSLDDVLALDHAIRHDGTTVRP